MDVACHSASLNIPLQVLGVQSSSRLSATFQTSSEQQTCHHEAATQQDHHHVVRWLELIQNDPVIATSVVSNGKGYFVGAKDTDATHKTAEACKATFEDSKSHAETTYGCKIRSFVTDNAKNMDKMHRELEEDDEKLIPYGCLSLMSSPAGTRPDTTPIMKYIIEMNKIFRNHHVPSAWLKGQLGSNRPQLPSETRWKGQLICLDS